MSEKKILLGLTTTWGSDWREKIEEIKKFNIKEIALFQTTLNVNERQDLYELMQKKKIQTIHHVHLREQDFSSDEISFLINRYKTKVFNIHAYEYSLDFLKKTPLYANLIYIENIEEIPENFENLVKQSGGMCIDLSHYYDFGILQKARGYDTFLKIADKYKIGCNHISAIKKTIQYLYDAQHYRKIAGYNDHHFDDLSEFDYLKNIPKKYFSNYISIELENPFEEQLRVKEYLEKIINNS